jgi:hypothetical protein
MNQGHCFMPWQPETTPVSPATGSKKPQDSTDHNCINLRLATYGGLYAWKFERAGRELKVRVDGQLVFNGTAQMINAAQAEFSFGVCAGRCGLAAFS